MSNRIVPETPRVGTWEPKFPEFAEPGEALFADDGQQGGDWLQAPDDSHLEAFKLDDPRTSRVMRLAGTAVLHVRFKAAGRQPAKEYKYYFRSSVGHAGNATTDNVPEFVVARRIFSLMVGHPDPGEIVHSELIKGRVPYERVV